MADVDDYKALGLRALAAGFPRRRWEGPAFCAPDAEWRDDRGVLWRGGDGPDDRWPDFRDPATLGVLRAQVRERWGGALIHTGEVCYPPDMDRDFWVRIYQLGRPERGFTGFTEAETLAAALEAAT